MRRRSPGTPAASRPAAHAQPPGPHAAAGGVRLGGVRPGLRAAARARHRHPPPAPAQGGGDLGARRKDIDRALATLERAFRLDLPIRPCGPICGASPPSSPTRNRWDAVCAIFQRAADAATRDEAVSLHHEVARFREELGQHEQAEACYQAILLLKPEDEVALAHLERVLRTQERWPELAALLDKRTTGTLEALPPGTLRRQRTLELAELYDNRLERPYEAIDTYERFVGSVDEDARGTDHPRGGARERRRPGSAGAALCQGGDVAQGGRSAAAADRARAGAGAAAHAAAAAGGDLRAGAGAGRPGRRRR